MSCGTYSAPSNILADEKDFQPGFGPSVEQKVPLTADPDGQLRQRGLVLTDEGGYRGNFANASLAVSIGTCTFTNGSDTVTGSGFDVVDLHRGDYVYLDSDGASYAVQIDEFTATTLTLSANYAGTSATGAASRQFFLSKVGTGGSIAVSNGACTITPGTTNDSVCELERDVDYLPLVKQCRFSISQRIANQTIYAGFYDENSGGAARWYFWFQFDGTNNTNVKCVCAWNPTVAPSGGEISTTTVALPAGAVTSSSNRYRIEILKDRVGFFINDVNVYTEYSVVPHPHDILASTIRTVNGTGAAGGTTVVIDFDTCFNFDAVSTENPSRGGMTVEIAGATANVPLTASPQDITRDGFISQDSTVWDFSNKAASDLLYNGGNVAGAGWLSIIKSALVPDTYTEIITKKSFPLSVMCALGMSLSNRINAQEFAFELVGVDSTGAVQSIANPAAVQLSNAAGAVSTGSVLTYTTLTPHGLSAGDVICVYGCTDSRVNYGPTVVTTAPTTTTFTISTGIGAATYTVGTSSYVREFRACGFATYMAGHRFIGATAGNNDFVSKNGAGRPITVNTNTGNTNDTATTPNENGVNYSNLAYAYSYRAKTEYALRLTPKTCRAILRDCDTATSAPRGTSHRSQNVPDPTLNYKFRIRARNMPNMAYPIAPITVAAKSASATATLTVPNHGLTGTTDRIIIYGIRDQTNFANQTTSVAIASVVNANQITVSFGANTTATSYGGWIAKTHHNDAGILTSVSSSVQSYQKTADGLRLQLNFLASMGTNVAVGDTVTVYGLVDSTNTQISAVYGRYRVDTWNTASFTTELTPLDGQSLAAVSTSPSNAGTTLIKNSEMRLHFFRSQRLQPIEAEVMGGPGDQDVADSLPVSISQGLGGTSAMNASQWGGATPMNPAANGSTNRAVVATLGTAVINTDQSATAYAGSGRVNGTVVAAATGGGGAVITAEVNVSALTLGTASSVVAILQESNGGTNFTDIWTSDPVTTTGRIRVPAIPVAGRRRWCVHSVGGTSTTVTVTVDALELPSGYVVQRQYRDAYAATNPLATVINGVTQTATTLINTGATCMTATSQQTPGFIVEGCKVVTMFVTLGNGPTVTTQPILSLEFSNDLTNWWTSAATITAAGNGTYSATAANICFRYARIRVTTAAAYSAGNYTITAIGANGVN